MRYILTVYLTVYIYIFYVHECEDIGQVYPDRIPDRIYIFYVHECENIYEKWKIFRKLLESLRIIILFKILVYGVALYELWQFIWIVKEAIVVYQNFVFVQDKDLN